MGRKTRKQIKLAGAAGILDYSTDSHGSKYQVSPRFVVVLGLIVSVIITYFNVFRPI